MKQVELYQWITDSETPPGRRIRTRHHMSREEALARDPTAEPVLQSLMVINQPVTEEEHWRAMNQRGDR